MDAVNARVGKAEKACRSALACWRQDHAGFWDTAVQNSSLRAALLRSVKAEVWGNDGLHAAFAFSDFRDFYGAMTWDRTISAARQLDFSLEPLAMAMLAHSSP